MPGSLSRYGAPVTSLAAIRGYLLEEALAWPVRTSGYRPLVNVHGDLDGALTSAGNGLLVKGRGANHQADTLGEFAFVPPFSPPIRLFVEAKFRTETTGIYDVRNASGVISDVNDECSAKRATQGHGKPTGHTGRTPPIANADCVIGPRSHQPERTQVTPGWDMPTQVSGGVGTLLIAPS